MVRIGHLCVLCKGSRSLCGLKRCPLMAKYYLADAITPKLKKEFFGPSTSVFVGHHDYPNVFVGPMQALQDVQQDNIAGYFGKPYEEVINARASLLRSKLREGIQSKSRFIQENRELSMAIKPIDVEAHFKKIPYFDVKFSMITQPEGPSGEIYNLRITENIKVKPAVEKIVTDDLKSAEQIKLLYNEGQNVYKITNILSTGALGLGTNQKLVPTRWSITAVDDLLGKQLISQIKELPSLNEFWVFESRYLDNHFVILLLPGSWQFENFEAWAPGSTWGQNLQQAYFTEDFEDWTGRKTYAEHQAGGYYAARLGILEGLKMLRRQATVVSFREIAEGYVVPVGVWVVRETVRDAFRGVAAKFATKQEALDYVKSRLNLPLNNYLAKSKILRQGRLSDFFSA